MRDKLKGKNLLYLLLAVNILLLGVNAFLFWNRDSSGVENTNAQYPYLSRRIFTENQNDILINFTPLRQAMRDYVNKQNGNVGVYFEYLPSGTSVGVNDQMEAKIASLVKIPVVMAAYKAAEDGKLDLNKTMTIDQEDLDKSFGDLWKRGAGAKITVNEAIDLMLTKSDNTATRVLTDELPEFAIENVFDSLDLPKVREEGFAVISPKSYTSILRSLYLSSYIQRGHSNLILDTLTRTDFSDKLPAGVPSEVPVAHKIGVYDQDSQHPIYSDCGVVYLSNRPYALCVMTKDLDENTSRQHMQLLSKMVYGYVAQVSK
jgi:beta-lactamase class A